MKTTLSNEAATEIALQFVLMDAIEKGATKSQLIDFMASDECQKAVANYKALLNEGL